MIEQKMAKLEKRMTMPSHKINRKKAKTNLAENYKKRVQFVTLTAAGAFKVISPKSTYPNQDQDSKPQSETSSIH